MTIKPSIPLAAYARLRFAGMQPCTLCNNNSGGVRAPLMLLDITKVRSEELPSGLGG